MGAKFKGRITNITDYGAFVELEPGVEGLVHVSEMSWTKKNVHPGKIVSTSRKSKWWCWTSTRPSAASRSASSSAWPIRGRASSSSHPVGTELEGEVKNITEFGLFVGLAGDIDGMVHLSDLDWDKAGEEAIRDYKKGDIVKAKVLDVDVEKERISLGIKQLAGDPFEKVGAVAKKGDVSPSSWPASRTTASTSRCRTASRASSASPTCRRDRSEQRPDRFAVGDQLDAKITNIDKAARRVVLSVKARELDEEKKAMADFGSSDSGASLGDILGAALRSAQKKETPMRTRTKTSKVVRDDLGRPVRKDRPFSYPSSRPERSGAEDLFFDFRLVFEHRSPSD